MKLNFFEVFKIKLDWKAVVFISLAPAILELVKRF